MKSWNGLLIPESVVQLVAAGPIDVSDSDVYELFSAPTDVTGDPLPGWVYLYPIEMLGVFDAHEDAFLREYCMGRKVDGVEPGDIDVDLFILLGDIYTEIPFGLDYRGGPLTVPRVVVNEGVPEPGESVWTTVDIDPDRFVARLKAVSTLSRHGS